MRDVGTVLVGSTVFIAVRNEGQQSRCLGWTLPSEYDGTNLESHDTTFEHDDNMTSKGQVRSHAFIPKGHTFVLRGPAQGICIECSN